MKNELLQIIVNIIPSDDKVRLLNRFDLENDHRKTQKNQHRKRQEIFQNARTYV